MKNIFKYSLISAIITVWTGTALFCIDHHVTTTEDHVEGSLRAALILANNNNEVNRIYLPAGTYLLTGTSGEDANAGGDLDFDNGNHILLIGEGAMVTTIDGNQNDRVLHIVSGRVSVSGVTLRGGRTADGSGETAQIDLRDGEPGGAVLNRGILELSSCYITASSTGLGRPCGDGETAGNGGHGGGIYNSIDARIELSDCFVSNNRTGTGGSNIGGTGNCTFGAGGSGGGIYNAGTLTLLRCTISSNSTGSGGSADVPGEQGGCGGDGGGIFNSGKQTLTECYITDNLTGNGLDSLCPSCTVRGGHGGGIYCDSGTTYIAGTVIRNNTTGSSQDSAPDGFGGFGGGIYNNGSLTVSQSSIGENATGSGVNGGHGGGIYNGSILQLFQTAIYKNLTGSSANTGNGGNGGGIYNANSINLRNCTVSTNTTGSGDSNDTDPQPGNGGDGGGIYNSGEPFFIDHCTISFNTTGGTGTAPNHAGSRPGFGGGIYSTIPGIRIFNSILADNTTGSDGHGADCFGAVESAGYNIFRDQAGYTVTGIATGNITGQDPMLQGLSQNGGIGPTHALLPGSPALDAGTARTITDTSLVIDQRGYTRPSDIPGLANLQDGSDIGAFEAVATITVSGTVRSGNTGLKNVTLTFSNNGGSTLTDPDGRYHQNVPFGWSGTVTPAKTDYTFSPIVRQYAVLVADTAGQNFTANPISDFIISVAPNRFDAGADTSQNKTSGQYFIIGKTGPGLLNWSTTADVSWLSCSPASGNGSATPGIIIDSLGLSPGSYTGTISVQAPGASNSPQTVTVNLQVYERGTTQPPRGAFDLPENGAHVSSSIPVTGWVLDDIMIDSLKIYRAPMPGEGNEPVLIDEAVFILGARPDVEAAFPSYPHNSKAGWGYMLLTNGLPGGGNGTYILHAVARDTEGNTVSLGTKTIFSDNANAVKPFGAIDTPRQGGTASGIDFKQFGWVLTPQPNSIPFDGSTITVIVDGKPLGNPVYNQYRSDIAAFFPGYRNSSGAAGYFILDTTPYENGVHTIEWTVTDNAGNRDGIGSRFFSIYNTPEGRQSAQSVDRLSSVRFLQPSGDTMEISRILIPVEIETPGPQGKQRLFFASSRRDRHINSAEQLNNQSNGGDESGTIHLNPGERVEIHFNGPKRRQQLSPGEPVSQILAGYLAVDQKIKPLPVGSTLDAPNRVFYWQPGPGFYGTFRLVFLMRDNNRITRNHLSIRIGQSSLQH